MAKIFEIGHEMANLATLSHGEAACLERYVQGDMLRPCVT